MNNLSRPKLVQVRKLPSVMEDKEIEQLRISLGLLPPLKRKKPVEAMADALSRKLFKMQMDMTPEQIYVHPQLRILDELDSTMQRRLQKLESRSSSVGGLSQSYEASR